MLIELTTASRAIGIHHLNMKNMGKLHSQVVFQCDKLHNN